MNKNIFKLILIIIEIYFIFTDVVVDAHYIDDGNIITEGEVIDGELENFKKILKGAAILKAEDMEEDEKEESNSQSKNSENKNNDYVDENKNSFLGPIKIEIDTADNVVNANAYTNKNVNSNDNINTKENININKDVHKDINSTENKNTNSNININKIEHTDIINNDEQQEEQQQIIDNISIIEMETDSIENDTVDKNQSVIEEENLNSNPEINDNKKNNKTLNNNNEDKDLQELKKVEIIKDHKNFKFKGLKENKENEYANGNTNKTDTEKEYIIMDEEDDEEIKNFVKFIIESEGFYGDETIEKEKDLFNKVKTAISNKKLDKLIKAKQKNLNKGINNYNPGNNITEENKTEDTNQEEENYLYKCNFDQDCTNFQNYTPDIAACNKTSNYCSNYCYVQKSCLEDSDCSTSCGSWCLKDIDMVFGHCVMSFDENDFCMESWRVCKDGLVCNLNTFVCERPHISLTFTRIESQESLILIVIFLILSIFLIKHTRNRDFISFFSGYNLNDYCVTTAHEYDPLPEYQRTEELNPDEMQELVERSTLEPLNEGSFIEENDNEQLYCDYYDENNQSINCNYIPVRSEISSTLPQNIENTDINIHYPSISSLSDSNDINEPPQDYEE